MSQRPSQQIVPGLAGNGPKPTIAAQPSGSSAISDEAVAKRAYEKFVARGCTHGHDQEDWAAAREELTAEVGHQTQGNGQS